jgi:hypothetical protein
MWRVLVLLRRCSGLERPNFLLQTVPAEFLQERFVIFEMFCSFLLLTRGRSALGN